MKLFSEIVQFWKETWEQSKSLFLAEAFGTILALSAATMLTITGGQFMVALLSVYIVSNLCFIYATYIRKSSWMMVMSLGFILINIAGIIIHL